jgi:hypothetical protein
MVTVLRRSRWLALLFAGLIAAIGIAVAMTTSHTHSSGNGAVVYDWAKTGHVSAAAKHIYGDAKPAVVYDW